MTICEDIQNAESLKRYDIYEVFQENRDSLTRMRNAIELNRGQNTEIGGELFTLVDRSFRWLNGIQDTLSGDSSFSLRQSSLINLGLSRTRTTNTLAANLSALGHISEAKGVGMQYFESVISGIDKTLGLSADEYRRYQEGDLGFLPKVNEKKADAGDVVELEKRNENIIKLRKMSQRLLAENVITEQNALRGGLDYIKDANTKQKLQIAIDNIPIKLAEIYNNVKDSRKVDLENNRFINFIQFITPGHEKGVTEDLFYNMFPSLTPGDGIYKQVIKINGSQNDVDTLGDLYKQVSDGKEDGGGGSIMKSLNKGYDKASNVLITAKLIQSYINMGVGLVLATGNAIQAGIWGSLKALGKSSKETASIESGLRLLHKNTFSKGIVRPMTQQATGVLDTRAQNPLEQLLGYILGIALEKQSYLGLTTGQTILEGVKNSKIGGTRLGDVADKFLRDVFSSQSGRQDVGDYVNIDKKELLSYMEAYRAAGTTVDEMLALSKQKDSASQSRFNMKKAQIEGYKRQSFLTNYGFLTDSPYGIGTNNTVNRIKQIFNFFGGQPLVVMTNAVKVLVGYGPAILINAMRGVPTPKRYLELTEAYMRNMTYSYIIGEKMLRIKDRDDFKERDPLEYLLDMVSLLSSVIPVFSMIQANSVGRLVTNTLTDIQNGLSNEEVVKLVQEGVLKEFGRVVKSLSSFVEPFSVYSKTDNLGAAVENLLDNITSAQDFLYQGLPGNSSMSDMLFINNNQNHTLLDYFFSTDLSIDKAIDRKKYAQELMIGTKSIIDAIPIIKIIRNFNKAIEGDYNVSGYKTTDEQVKLNETLNKLVFTDGYNDFVNNPVAELANMSPENVSSLLSTVFKTVDNNDLAFMVDRIVKGTSENKGFTEIASSLLIQNGYFNPDGTVDLDKVSALWNSTNTDEAKKRGQINALAETENPGMGQVLMATIAKQLKAGLDGGKMYYENGAIYKVNKKGEWYDEDGDGDLDKIKGTLPSGAKKKNEEIVGLLLLPLVKSTNKVMFAEIMKEYMYLEKDRLGLANNIVKTEENGYTNITIQDDNGNAFGQGNYGIPSMVNIQEGIAQGRDEDELINLANIVNLSPIRVSAKKKEGKSDIEKANLQQKVNLANLEIIKYGVSKVKTTNGDPYLKNIVGGAILVRNTDVLTELSDNFDSLDEESKGYVSQAISEVIRTSGELKATASEIAGVDKVLGKGGKGGKGKKNSVSSLIDKLDDLVKTSSVPYTTLSLPKPDDFRIKFSDRDYNYMRSYASTIGSYKAEAKSEQYDTKPKSIKYNPQRKYNIGKRKSTKSKKSSKGKSNRTAVRVIA